MDLRSKHEAMLQWLLGIPNFTDVQYKAVLRVLSGKNTFVIAGTGAGKSAIAQYAALVSCGIAVVITPYVAIATDQVQQLRSVGVPAAVLGEDDGLFFGGARPLGVAYTTPESVNGGYAQKTIAMFAAAGALRLVAIDEVHEVLVHGRTFRPSMTKLARTLENVAPAAPLLLLTATAPPSVLRRAHTAFGMGPRDMLRAPLDRPNIRYEVTEVPQKDAGNTICMCCGTGCFLCLSFIPRLAHVQGRALLYTATRASAAAAAAALRRFGVRAGSYHAEMCRADRANVHAQWAAGALRVVCCTKAFSTGVHTPDIALVFHESAPLEIVQFAQEAGRGGRDGRPCRSVVVYDAGQHNRAIVLAWRSASNARARGDHAAAAAVHDMLVTAEAMRTFCTTTRCRRRVLLSAMCSPLGYWVSTRWCCDNCHCNGMQCG